jgi:hypothetical protein
MVIRVREYKALVFIRTGFYFSGYPLFPARRPRPRDGHSLGFCKSSGGGPLDHPLVTTRSIRLRPYTPRGAQRTFITSCWSAPGLNRRPPAVMLKTAVRSGPAPPDDTWTGSSGQPRVHAPIREYGFLPHIERDLLLSSGPAGPARACAFVGIWRSTMWSALHGLHYMYYLAPPDFLTERARQKPYIVAWQLPPTGAGH